MDTGEDARKFDHFARRACELGDAEACSFAKSAPDTYSIPTDVARRRAIRSRPEEVGISRYRDKKNPEFHQMLLNEREACSKGYDCFRADLLVFKRDLSKPRADKRPLAPDEVTLVTDICKATHDCGELMMVLDKSG